MKSRTLILLASTLMAAISFSSCKKNDSDFDHSYFMYSYTNMAWVYQHEGWVVDKDGQVLKFDKPEDWKNADEDDYISKSDLLDNLKQCSETGVSVSQSVLDEKNSLVPSAANGSLSSPKNTLVDAGSLVCECFLYQPRSKRYKRITLDVRGDWSYHNNSDDAKKLVEWMNEIQAELN